MLTVKYIVIHDFTAQTLVAYISRRTDTDCATRGSIKGD